MAPLVCLGIATNYGQVRLAPAGNDYVAAIGGDSYHSLALKADGSLEAWGSNESTRASARPTGNDFVAVAAGGKHSLALQSDGSLEAGG